MVLNSQLEQVEVVVVALIQLDQPEGRQQEQLDKDTQVVKPHTPTKVLTLPVVAELVE
jgi:hypothetical protein